jgi:hypothetical protein
MPLALTFSAGADMRALPLALTFSAAADTYASGAPGGVGKAASKSETTSTEASTGEGLEESEQEQEPKGPQCLCTRLVMELHQRSVSHCL